MYCNTKTLTAESGLAATDPNVVALNKGLSTWKTWTKKDSKGLFTEVNSPAVIESMGTLNFVKGEGSNADDEANEADE